MATDLSRRDARDPYVEFDHQRLVVERPKGAALPGTVNRQLHPITDRQIFRLAHTPDITLLHVVGQ